MVDRARVKSGDSNKCQFYLCTVGCFLHTLYTTLSIFLPDKQKAETLGVQSRGGDGCGLGKSSKGQTERPGEPLSAAGYEVPHPHPIKLSH